MSQSDPTETLRNEQRLVFRCVTEFLIAETGRLTRRHDGDFARAATFLAIAQASNSLPGDRDPARPPRPVSIRSLSVSLAIPFETTRRKVAALEAAGVCRREGDAGIVATEAAFQGEAYSRGCRETRQLLAGLVAELRMLGADPGRIGGAIHGQAERGDGEIDEIVSALTGSSILRMLEAGVAVWETMVNTLLVAALVTRNAGVVTHDRELARLYAGAGTPPPDSLRVPVTVAELSKHLSFSYDVVNRRMKAFQVAGLVSRERGGYLFSMAVQQRPEVLNSGLMVVQRFYQMLQTLRAMGIDPAVAAQG